jgi:phenylacetic acid degradation operon negative regulatory protein
MFPVTLKPRSLVLDLFGAYLRYVGAEVRLAQLTELLATFDVAPATVRVTMSRLRREGWFSSRREGRETVYTLSPAMLKVLDEGRAAIFAPAARSWERTWTMVIYQMSESERLERTQLRKSLSWHGFGPLTTSTWLAPGDRRSEVAAFLDSGREDQVDVLSCSSDGLERDRDLARRCWDLDALARDYQVFNNGHHGLIDRAESMSPADSLVARTELISTFRHFPFRDPRLPAELRPEPWPGEEAHTLFVHAYEALGAAARQHVGGIIGEVVPAESASVVVA